MTVEVRWYNKNEWRGPDGMAPCATLYDALIDAARLVAEGKPRVLIIDTDGRVRFDSAPPIDDVGAD